MNKKEIEKAIENMNSHVKAYENNLKSINTVNSINKDWNGLSASGQTITIDDKRYVYTVESLQACYLAIFALTRQLNNGWIPVSSGKFPKSEERVFICVNRKRHDGKIVQIRTIAMYEDGTMHTDDSGFSWEDHEFDYCDETDDYIISEGWWEQNMYCEEFGMIDDFVTHWQPLPELYEEDTDECQG